MFEWFEDNWNFGNTINLKETIHDYHSEMVKKTSDAVSDFPDEKSEKILGDTSQTWTACNSAHKNSILRYVKHLQNYSNT